MPEGKAKKYLLTALVLVLILAAVTGFFLYLSKVVYSPEELSALGKKIEANQNSDKYRVIVAQPNVFDPSSLFICLEDMTDERIKAFKQDWPDLPYRQIEFKELKDIVFSAGT